MNAGFFDTKTNQCLGNVYSDSKYIHTAADDNPRAIFGLLEDGSLLIGYVNNSVIQSNHIGHGFKALVEGAGWLIRDSQINVNQSDKIEHLGNHFITEKAPRNAIGWDKQGRLLMFQIDGDEILNQGYGLFEFAEVLLQIGMVQAINLDGGGSSTTVYQQKLVSQPTCIDIPLICERAVTTITCVKSSH